MYQNSRGVRKLLKRQKEKRVLWWPYYGADAMGIETTREWLKQRYSSKL